MKRSTERILTTHVGSLPRPQDLLEQVVADAARELRDRARFEARLREAVAEAVRLQVENGLDIVNDGELPRASYFGYVTSRLDGFGGSGRAPYPSQTADLLEFPGYMQRMFAQVAGGPRPATSPACIGPVAYRDRGPLRRDIENLKAAAAAGAGEAFLTAASPGVATLLIENQHYANEEDYLWAMAEAMREEYRAIIEAGLLLQVDCPDLAMGRHIGHGDWSLERFRAYAERHVEALNHALAGLPEDRLRMHLCWGNYEGPHHRDVALKDIIDIVFKGRPSAILYEAANPRHAHEWRVFEDVKLPQGKVLVPGVIDTTTNFIEHPELVAQRIFRLAELVGHENVIAGADCGFASGATMVRVDPQIVWAKFRTLAEGARLASQELWG
jgi:5-methyltetrahydropteroyltriglutamate--homocysteine methyltransferase